MMGKGKYYWKFQALINEILQEQKTCAICGSKENLNLHHLVHCRSFEKKYADKNNIIVLCRDCHWEYHNRYSKVSPYTLFSFMREKYTQKYVNDVTALKKELHEYQDLVNYLTQMQ